jgi:hypothetical protein
MFFADQFIYLIVVFAVGIWIATRLLGGVDLVVPSVILAIVFALFVPWFNMIYLDPITLLAFFALIVYAIMHVMGAGLSQSVVILLVAWMVGFFLITG